MAELRIELDKEDYRPGDEIHGQVHLTTDKVESYQGLRLDFKGTMESKAVRGSGKHRRVYIEKSPIIDSSQFLSEELDLQMGLTSFEFTLQIPSDAPGSYHGHMGWIHYTIKVVLEKNNWPDQGLSIPVIVAWIVPQKAIEAKPFQKSIQEEDHIPLAIDVDSDVLTLGKDFTFRLKVSEQQKLREVRAFIAYKEQVAPHGYREENIEKLASWKIPEMELVRNSWLDANLATQEQWPYPFMSELIWTQIVLRVEIDVPYRFDVVIEVPLKVQFPTKDNHQTRDSEPMFDWE